MKTIQINSAMFLMVVQSYQIGCVVIYAATFKPKLTKFEKLFSLKTMTS